MTLIVSPFSIEHIGSNMKFCDKAELQIRRSIEDNSKIIFLISQ